MCNEVEASPFSAGEVYSVMQANEGLGAMVMFLSRELSRARILTNQDECCRCAKYSLESCARCWRKVAAEAVKEERIFR